MKTIFKFLAIAMLLTTFSAVTVTKTYAQDPAAEKKALYDTHLANYAQPMRRNYRLRSTRRKRMSLNFPKIKNRLLITKLKCRA